MASWTIDLTTLYVLSHDFVDTWSHEIVDTMSQLFVDTSDTFFWQRRGHGQNPFSTRPSDNHQLRPNSARGFDRQRILQNPENLPQHLLPHLRTYRP